MRIGIDIRDLASGVVGVGKAILDMIDYLEANDRENQYFLYQNEYHDYTSTENFKKKITSIQPYSFYREQIYFSARSLIDRLDLAHFPIHLPPALVKEKTKIVFTVHDLHSELDPAYFPPAMNRYFLKRRLEAIHRADAVIVHSDFVKQKVIELTGAQESKIHKIGRVVSRDHFQPATDEAKKKVREKYSLPERFILYVGSLEPWKRVPFLIRSFLEYCAQTKDKISLVLIGRDGWNIEHNREIDELVDNNSEVRLLGYVPQEDMSVFYQMAQAFCSASVWEGFGLIFLEAMAAGIPIIASKCSAVPETVQNAGFLIARDDAEDFTAKLTDLLQNQKTHERLSRQSKERIQEFHVDQYGKSIRELYESLQD